MAKVIVYCTARHFIAIVRCLGRNEAVGIIAKSFIIYALKLNGEIGSSAVIRRIIAIRLAAGG